MDYKEFFRPSTLEETSEALRADKNNPNRKRKMYYIVWYKDMYLIVAPNELRKTDDVIIEVEADIWFQFQQDMIKEVGSAYNLTRQELHDALELYAKEYEEHWFEEGWEKTILPRIRKKQED